MSSNSNYQTNEGYEIKGVVKGIEIRKEEDFADACKRILEEYLNNGHKNTNLDILTAYEFSRTIRGEIIREVVFGKNLAEKLNDLNFIKAKNLI